MPRRASMRWKGKATSRLTTDEINNIIYQLQNSQRNLRRLNFLQLETNRKKKRLFYQAIIISFVTGVAVFQTFIANIWLL